MSGYNLFMFIVVIVLSVIVGYDIFKMVYYKKNLGRKMYDIYPSGRKIQIILIFFVLIVILLSFIAYLKGRRPDIGIIYSIIWLLLLMVQNLVHLLSPNSINKNGISTDGSYYSWDDINYFGWDGERTLHVGVKNRIFKFVGSKELKLYIDEKQKDDIDCFLTNHKTIDDRGIL